MKGKCIYSSALYLSKKRKLRGKWVAQSVGCLPLVQVMIVGSWGWAMCWAPCPVGSLLLPPLCLQLPLVVFPVSPSLSPVNRGDYFCFKQPTKFFRLDVPMLLFHSPCSPYTPDLSFQWVFISCRSWIKLGTMLCLHLKLDQLKDRDAWVT